MKNKIFIGVILFLIFCIFGLLIYINNVLAPITLKAKIIFELEKKLQARVSIENIRYNLFNGLILQNLSVYKETPDELYFSVKEIILNPLLAPLLKKKIIVPLALVDSPQIYLEFDENKNPRLPELNPHAAARPAKQEFSFIITKIGITDGEIYIKDKSVTPNFTKALTAVKIGADINLPGQIKFLLQAKVTNPQNNPSFISVEGEYNPGSQKLAAQLKLNNFLAKEYLPYLRNLPFLFSEGSLDADLKVGVNAKLLNVTGSVTSKTMVVRNDKFAFSGDLTLKPKLEYGLQDKSAKYNATIQISRGKFIGLRATKEITDIQGDIYLNETAARSANLKAKIFDSPAKISGLLENFTQPLLKLKISSDRLKLNTLAAMFPDAAKNMTVDGQARALVNINYDAANPPLKVKGMAEIDSPMLKAAALKEPVEKIKGIVVFSRGGLIWPHIFFTYKNVSYATSGNIKDFQSPQINCSLSSPVLSFKSSLGVRDDLLNITSFAGKYRESQFDIKGSLNSQTLALSLSGKVNLNLGNAFGLLAEESREKLQKFKLAGSCNLEGTVKGNPNEPKNLAADIKVTSGNFSIYDLKVNNTAFNLKQNNATLSVKDFTAKSYNGTVAAQANFNLTGDSPAYSTKFVIEKVDLAKLKQDTGLKDKDLAGSLNIKGELQGSAENFNTLKGSGYLTVKEGNIWEINLFKGLGEFLFVPIYQKIKFSEIDADFFIENQKVTFANSFLGGKMMELATNGYIGFDGALDLNMHARVSKALLEDSPDLRKFGSMIFGNLLNIKITGNLQKPEYKVVPFPKALFKEIRGFFLKR